MLPHQPLPEPPMSQCANSLLGDSPPHQAMSQDMPNVCHTKPTSHPRPKTHVNHNQPTLQHNDHPHLIWHSTESREGIMDYDTLLSIRRGLTGGKQRVFCGGRGNRPRRSHWVFLQPSSSLQWASQATAKRANVDVNSRVCTGIDSIAPHVVRYVIK
jgi:hypothetical protein